MQSITKCLLAIVLMLAGSVSIAQTLVAHAVSLTSVTTPAINTTGATLLVVACVDPQGVGITAPTDSAGNTWQAAFNFFSNLDINSAYSAMYYAYGPTTSTTHTFTCKSATSVYPIEVEAWSGTLATSAVFDKAVYNQNGRNPGSLTPAVAGELFITMFENGGAAYTSSSFPSFTLGDHGYGTGIGVSGVAYYINPGTTAVNSSWTISPNGNYSVTGMAAFKPAAASVPTPARHRLINR